MWLDRVSVVRAEVASKQFENDDDDWSDMVDSQWKS
jgi:hypothetical protein